MKKFRTILIDGLCALILFVVLVGAFTQTQIFRDRLRALALTELDSLLNADVFLGDIGGNLFTGFSIDSVNLAVAGRQVIALRRLDFSYNLFALPGRTISINQLTLVNPEVELYRDAGGEWNINRMIRVHDRDTTGSGRFAWVVTLRQLEILGGTLHVLDSAALEAPTHPERDNRTIEYHDVTLRHLNLVLSAELGEERKHVVISSLAFAMENPGFELKRLSGIFTVTPTDLQVDSLHIVTPRTSLAITGTMNDVDIFGGSSLRSLQHAPVDLSFIAHPVDLEELKKFLPPLDFLMGRVAIDLRTSGQFGDLIVQQLDVRVGASSLFLRGGIKNLHVPKEMLIGIKMTESTIDPGDVPALMPAFDLPDFSSAGPGLLNLEFEGKPTDFRTKFHFATPAGTIQSSGFSLAAGGPSDLTYSGSLLFSGLDLGRIVDDERLGSRLNGSVLVKGKGVRFGQMVSTLTLQVDSSTFRGLPVKNTHVSVDALGREVTASANLALGEMRAALSGEVDGAGGSLPAFHVDGDVSSLDLQHILHDSTYSSDITMKMNATGTGFTWNSLNGSLVLDLTSSRFRDYNVTQGDVELTINQKDTTNKRLQFDSNIADLTLTGSFDLGYLIALVAYEIANLRSALGEKFAAFDSSLVLNIDRKSLEAAGRRLKASGARLDARYVVRVKDLEPLSVAAGDRTFNGVGLLSGMIRGNYDELAMSGELAIDDFFYGNADAGILVEEGRASLDIRSLKPVNPLKGIGFHAEASASKLLVNRNSLDTLDVTVDLRNEGAEYALRTTLNNSYRLHTEGSARLNENSLSIAVQSLDLADQDFAWRADPGAQFRINHVSAELHGLVMRRDSQAVAVEAVLGAGRTITATVDGTHLDLDDLKYLLADEELGPQGQSFAGGASVHATATGTLSDPVLSASVTGENVSFRTLPFGRVTGEFQYERQELVSKVRVNAAGSPQDSTPALTIDGSLPIDLRFEGSGKRILDLPMNLRVISRGVQMNVLDPLLPTFNQLSGVMTCDLTLTGTLRHPAYDGVIGVSECTFLFVPNNMLFTLNGTFHPEGERIHVIDCVVHNVQEDERAGRQGMLRIGGDFSLRDLTPGDFNITAEGQLLVVKETTRRSSLEVYGDLFVEIGPGPLRFTGEVENSLLKGSLLIMNSNLIFPPTQTAVVEESAHSIPVEFVDDTLKTPDLHERSRVAQYFEQGQSMSVTQPGVELKRSKSIMEGLHYDLDIETSGGNTEIRMIFNPATSEELVATLEGRFSITDDGTRWTGELTVDRAYYNFFKRFDASGTIRFTGDFMNPELNIRATYKGTRTLVDSTGAGRAPEVVVVTVKITGTRREPGIEFSMTIDDVDYYSYPLSRGPKSNDLQSDAMSFIVAGTFPLTAAQRNDVATQVQSTAGFSLLSGATSLLTGRLSDSLRTETGFINSVELSYGGRESTELRLSGTAWNGYWRYGGTILNDPLSNANFSILYSFGTIFNNPLLRNFMLELERRVEPTTFGQTSDLKRVNSARLFYRFSF